MSAQAPLEHGEWERLGQLRITEGPETWKLGRAGAKHRFQEFARSLHRRFIRVLRYLIESVGWLKKNVRVSRSAKRMRIRESVGLGDKRMLALLEIDGQSFLIGASPNSVSLLAEMTPSPDFRQILCQKQEFSS